MSVVIDTSVFIDVLRGHPGARTALRTSRRDGALRASEITRLELLMGMRPTEEQATRGLLAAVQWHPVDEEVSELAGQLGRTWLRSHGGIDPADLAIAATAVLVGATVLTRNVRHFPMFEGLLPPY